MSVYFKFNSELNYSHVDFDGLHISVSDLKKAIVHQKRIGKNAEFDLLISNAQTKEEYVEDECLIPKNTSLIVARVPINTNVHAKKWDHQQQSQLANAKPYQNEQHISSASSENVDLSRMNGTEEDKIQAMMIQSTLDYDPLNYQRVRGIQVGEVPQNYRCHRCQKTGHWIKNCPLNPPLKENFHSKVRAESKKMTGIPRSLRENPPVNQENHQITEQPKKEIPEDLICSICKSIFKDAVMIPCCGSSFCDECIRTALLESDDNECPDCKEKGTSPGSLIPNRFLRNAVTSFYSDQTGSREKPVEESKGSENSVRRGENLATQDQSSTVASPSESDFVEVNEIRKEHLEDELPANSNDAEKLEKNNDNYSDDDEDDDNITVTVPSQQNNNAFMNIHRQNSQKSHETQEYSKEEAFNDKEKQKANQYSEAVEPYYGNNSYEEPMTGNSHGPCAPEGADKNFMMRNNSNQPPYHQIQYQPSHIHMRPMYQGPDQYQQPNMPGMQQPYYNSQNPRPMRYDHGNYHPIRHHHHHHQQYPHSMHSMNDYGMRYQQPHTNLANIVSHNIQQRFGTGIIDDPLEAFNKIMREKEMRKDRFKRSPVRFKEGRSRSPGRQYSPPDNRQKSPIKRRKRSRSFSSSSKSYSRSRSRSFDRHYNKDNFRGRERRKRHYPPERYNERSRVKSKSKVKEHTNESPRKNTYEASNQAATTEKQEKHDVAPAPANDVKTTTPNIEPPPPGEEQEVDVPVLKEFEEKPSVVTEESEPTSAKKNSSDKSSSEETKHSKKYRERKKHKKSETRSKKKKKRDKREKKSSSKSNTPEIKVEKMKQTDEPARSVTPEKNNAAESEQRIEGDEKSVWQNPELSKWEIDETPMDKSEENIILKESTKEEGSEVTSEVLKRAENVIFSKSQSTSNIAKTSSTTLDSNNKKKEGTPVKKTDSDKKFESFQVTVPNQEGGTSRSVEVKSSENSAKSNKDSSVRSIKDRLGKKIHERSRSRSRARDKRFSDEKKRTISSCISSVATSVRKASDIESSSRANKSTNSYRGRDTGRTKRYQRSRTRSPVAHRKSPHDTSEAKSARRRSSDRKRSRHRSRSHSTDDKERERKKMRSSSVESKKHKKKKKKEKKTKKKSRDRK